MNINKCLIGGRITYDPELKKTTAGDSISEFTVAVTRPAKKGDTAKTDFINCVAFGATADHVYKYYKKGTSIIVFGAMRNDEWTDKDGNKRSKMKVRVEEVQFGSSPQRQKENEAKEPATESNDEPALSEYDTFLASLE